MFLTKDQVGSVTVEELRTELRKFGSEAALHDNLRRAVQGDMQTMLIDLHALLAKGFHEDMEKMLSDLQASLVQGVHADIQKMFVDFQASILEQLAERRQTSKNALPRPPSDLLADRGPIGKANLELRNAAVQDGDDGAALATIINVTECELPGIVVEQAVDEKDKVTPPSTSTCACTDDDCAAISRQLSESPVQSRESDQQENDGRMGRRGSVASHGSTDSSVDSYSNRRSTKATAAGSEGQNPMMKRQASRVISSAKQKEDSKKGGALGRASAAGVTDASAMTARQSVLFEKIKHPSFEYVTAIFILLNGALIGFQSDLMAREHLKTAPTLLEALEVLFCIVFTVELCLRLYVYRRRFFSMPGWSWNVFDFVIVCCQIVEIFLKVVGSSAFNSVLETLRLMRILRLARVLRLIGELRSIVSSIVGSLRPLFWTAVLLFLAVYVLGICLTQAVHSKRMALIEENKPVPQALDTYWSSVTESMFALFASITGGVDWDSVCRPLIDHIGTEVGFLFGGYILFTVLIMLNVVTGVFIDSVMTNATREKEMKQISHVQAFFEKLDVDESGEISWDEFEQMLLRKDMREFFKTIDVDIENARSLFELLDLDCSGSVDVNEFMDGCLRIWSPAKGLDLRMILRDVNRILVMMEKKDMARAQAQDEDEDDTSTPAVVERTPASEALVAFRRW